MRRLALTLGLFALPSEVAAQAADPVIFQFIRFADIYGSRLVDAFDSIPAAKYGYRPTPVQQTIGYIAQHLENANYGLCARLSDVKRVTTAKDSLADTIKARWPKDTLVARLKASLRFCDDALERVSKLDSPALANNLLLLESDLAEHYSQLSNYMRLLGMVPPSALPPKKRIAIDLPEAEASRYVGLYAIGGGIEFEITLRDGSLFIRSNMGGVPVRLHAESRTDFFVNEADAEITFTRDASGTVTGLVVHQFGRDRPGRKVR
jgi:hypothetical protein